VSTTYTHIIANAMSHFFRLYSQHYGRCILLIWSTLIATYYQVKFGEQYGTGSGSPSLQTLTKAHPKTNQSRVENLRQLVNNGTNEYTHCHQLGLDAMAQYSIDKSEDYEGHIKLFRASNREPSRWCLAFASQALLSSFAS
jgi:hypothetical protein